MTISFETVDVPTKAVEKDITTNTYWPVIEAIKDVPGKAAKFTLPTEDGDDYKKATGRARTQLNAVSEHIGRTIRATFEQGDDSIRATVWVLDKKITRTAKVAPEATPEATSEATPEAAPEANVPDVADATPVDAPEQDTMVNRNKRRRS